MKISNLPKEGFVLIIYKNSCRWVHPSIVEEAHATVIKVYQEKIEELIEMEENNDIKVEALGKEHKKEEKQIIKD